MTQEEFKKIIPKANASELKDLGFGYICAIRKSFRPIWMQIPKSLYDSIPIGFPVINLRGEEEPFNPDIHKKHTISNINSNYLEIGLHRKDTLS